MNTNNTIKILLNIYLSDNYNIDLEFIKNNSIKTVIFINYSGFENIEEQNEFYDKINISISTNVNFDNINELIIDTLKKSNNILIISDKNLIGFVVISAFMINYLDVSFFQVLLLDKIYNIQINKTVYYKILHSYYCAKKNFLV
jgi:hypothetical protein